jgi:hypothetical protein
MLHTINRKAEVQSNLYLHIYDERYANDVPFGHFYSLDVMWCKQINLF